ncbi:QueT transporter family protein [Candidatus Contubernalis alkaliaceticus]|uniref:QueT transporter family protein n=1 Tax=Candidatus Contubernalis alkaliaceticus TaxID=338645 RepID=UPI001F4BFE44|nr:QueT transporter family protein [Candidatus Contubernalis alkalaceticus]UNC93490.1 QueT transporter family protein [Candidatus Contubernalis alkalaceticus]
MNEILSPFKQKQTLLQMGLCALVFIGMAVPFKVMMLVEGFTEVRPVNAVPVVAGLLFGPAGAWGCAIGNLVADLFGTFSTASILGFFGNFIAAYLPYKLWHTWKKGEKPNLKSNGNIGFYILLSAVSSLAVAIFLACGLDVFLRFWLLDIFYIILFNNFGFSLVLGLPVLIVLTSDNHNIQPHLPSDPEKHLKERKAAMALLLVAQTAILVMVVMGFSMSAFLLMSIAGGIFLLSLLSFILL